MGRFGDGVQAVYDDPLQIIELSADCDERLCLSQRGEGLQAFVTVRVNRQVEGRLTPPLVVEQLGDILRFFEG